jgi:hypothetical protein
MDRTTLRTRHLWLGVLGLILLAGLVACEKKRDPSVPNAGGGASPKRNIITMKGAAQ